MMALEEKFDLQLDEEGEPLPAADTHAAPTWKDSCRTRSCLGRVVGC